MNCGGFMGNDILVIGIGGHAVGIDPATGAELWRTKLRGGDFVTVHQAGPQVLAGASGVLFCLDTSTGKMLWKNSLKGLGTGLITFAVSEDAAAVATLARRRTTAAAVTAAGS
jgi:outer membrane protein assembly factor BamB